MYCRVHKLRFRISPIIFAIYSVNPPEPKARQRCIWLKYSAAKPRSISAKYTDAKPRQGGFTVYTPRQVDSFTPNRENVCWDVTADILSYSYSLLPIMRSIWIEILPLVAEYMD